MRGTIEQKIDFLKMIVKFKGYAKTRIGGITGVHQSRYDEWLKVFEQKGLVRVKRQTKKQLLFPTRLCFEVLKRWRELNTLLESVQNHGDEAD